MPCQLRRLLLEVSDDTITVHEEKDIDIVGPPPFIGTINTLVMGFIISIWKKCSLCSFFFQVHEFPLLP